MYEWVQMGHRAAAGIIFIWIGYIFYLAIKHYRHEKVIYWGWVIAFALVSLQVIAGAFIIFYKRKPLCRLITCFFYFMFIWFIELFSIYLCYRSTNKSNMQKPTNS